MKDFYLGRLSLPLFLICFFLGGPKADASNASDMDAADCVNQLINDEAGAETAESQYWLEQVFPNIQTVSPRLAEFLKSQMRRANRRGTDREMSMQQVADSIKLAHQTPAVHTHEYDNVAVHWVTQLKQDSLCVDIKSIKLKNLRYGRRPRVIHQVLSHLIEAIFSGAISVISSTPEIRHLKIGGVTVVNRPLRKLLSNLGFKGSLQKQTVLFALFYSAISAFTLSSPIHTYLSHNDFGFLDAFNITIGIVNTAISVKFLLNRNFTLDLEVDPAKVPSQLQ